MYTLIITETREEADALNAVLPQPTRGSKVQAYQRGYLFCGLHHNGRRPSAVISLTKLRDDDEWFRQILRPTMAHDAVWILP